MNSHLFSIVLCAVLGTMNFGCLLCLKQPTWTRFLNALCVILCAFVVALNAAIWAGS